MLAPVLGSCGAALVLGLALFCWKRARKQKKARRGWFARAVTPLDDAEFESWRRPAQFTKLPERAGSRPAPPPAALLRASPSPAPSPSPASFASRPPDMGELEKATQLFAHDGGPDAHSGSRRGASARVRKPDEAHAAAHVARADRPPTPFAQRGERRSPPRHAHHPSSSEASDWDSKAGSPRLEGRWSSQSDRRLHYVAPSSHGQ